MPGGEDAQPNEDRLSRKGTMLPPIVRSTLLPVYPRHAPPPNPYPPPPAWRSAKRARNAQKIQITVPFPPACRRGVAGSQKARKEWLPVVVRELEAQRGVRMVAFTYLDEALLPQPATPKEPSSSSSHALPPTLDSSRVARSDLTGISQGMPHQDASHGSDDDMDVSISPSPTDGSPRCLPCLDISEYQVGLSNDSSVALNHGESIHAIRAPVAQDSSSSRFAQRSGKLSSAAIRNCRPPSIPRYHMEEQSRSRDISASIQRDSLAEDATGSKYNAHSLSTRPHISSPGAASGFWRFPPKLRDSITRIPKRVHDKPRRLLLAPGRRPVIVTSHGFLDEIDVDRSRHRSLVWDSVPSVEDACLLPLNPGHLGVVAHAAEERQLSVIDFCDLSDTLAVTRPFSKNNTLKPAASVVSPMLQVDMFASGGYDHAIHAWKMKEDMLPTAETLAFNHTSVVQALLPVRDTSHKLISGGADCMMQVFDLSSERVVNTTKTSNSVHQLHNVAPFCVLLEVAHRDLQFEYRDYRLVPDKAVQRFGYDTAKLHGRFTKGALKGDMFVSPDDEGSVRIWDLRNTSVPLHTIPCFPNSKVLQVTFHASDILICSVDGQFGVLSSCD